MLYGVSDEGTIGANGVLAYYIENIDKTLGVMWIDAFQSNQWNIRLYDGEKEADLDMLTDLQDNTIVTTGIKDIPLTSGLKVIGNISSVIHPLITLEIHVHTLS